MKLINLALNSFGETYHGLRNRVPTQLAKIFHQLNEEMMTQAEQKMQYLFKNIFKKHQKIGLEKI